MNAETVLPKIQRLAVIEQYRISENPVPRWARGDVYEGDDCEIDSITYPNGLIARWGEWVLLLEGGALVVLDDEVYRSLASAEF